MNAFFISFDNFSFGPNFKSYRSFNFFFELKTIGSNLKVKSKFLSLFDLIDSNLNFSLTSNNLSSVTESLSRSRSLRQWLLVSVRRIFLPIRHKPLGSLKELSRNRQLLLFPLMPMPVMVVQFFVDNSILLICN